MTVSQFTRIMLSGCLSVVFFAGCGKEPSTSEPGAPVGDQAAQATPELINDTIRLLPPEKLEQLGAKNDWPTEWIYPNAFSATLIQPKRFGQYANADEVFEFITNSQMNVPFMSELKDVDLLMTCNKFSLVDVKSLDASNVIAQNYPYPSRSIYMRKSAPLDKKTYTDLMFSGAKPEDIKSMTFGDVTVQALPQPMRVPVNETGSEMALVDNIFASLYFPDDHSMVIATGSKDDLESFYSIQNGDERGVLAQRVGRLDQNSFDFAFLYDYDNPYNQMVPVVFLPPENVEAIMPSVLSAQWLIDANVAENGCAMKLTMECKSDENAASVKTALGGVLLNLVEDVAQGATVVEANSPVPDYLNGLDTVLKMIQMNVDKSAVTLTLNRTADSEKYFTNFFQSFNQFVKESEEKARQDMIENNLFALGQMITKYYSQFNQYPPLAITAPDGTPLLSWRVELLKAIPEAEPIYSQFKLDEPWDSPNNIKLLEKIPQIYASPYRNPETMSKTTFQIFSGTNTAFGQKPQGAHTADFANPGQTLMVVSTTPEYAVEWTKPDSLTLDPGTLQTVLGKTVLALPVMGDVFRTAFDGSPDQVAKLVGMLSGQPVAEEAAPAAFPDAPEDQQ